MKQVISKVLKTVIPSAALEKSQRRIADLSFELVNNEIKEFPEILGLEFGGSFAKGTWLSTNADIDIFVRFKTSTFEDDFEKISRKVGFNALKEYSPYVKYSEHPYVEAKIKNTIINVVPFYDVKRGEWKGATDRSTFHTQHMKKNLTVKMKNQVRLLKAFLAANGIYGAEIAKQGFSGYVTEVLILEFKNFENVINKMANIKEHQIIGKSKTIFKTPIVIIDPIDSNRNLAAAISNQNLGRFVLLSRSFKENPTLDFFMHKKLKLSKKYWDNLLVIKFNFKTRSPDIIWGQIKRAVLSVSTHLELGGFKVLRSKSHTDQQKEAYLFFLLESIEIPQNYLHSGPEFFRRDSSYNFVSKNRKDLELIWINQNQKIVSLKKRKHTNAINFITNFLKENPQTCISKGLQNDFKQGFHVSIGDKYLSKSIKEAASELISTDGVFLHFN